ncbi:hypothetical protein PHLGIDRAFT_31023 [Phlebiopsis gigantea 11061_1 CR5-6]|uniref:NAD(P)-binding domain-containing protein n=1 Tax=Phlebiopsis gigantea (strain 11061_1 CR5-6) TaxID=745531 RepID=A0A0C3S8A8_PHLG1|nr:hypothetical protein PHLGIDRAFT_31023 [Phlebiopsis gigantea 11061_1 CR5-6]
MASKTPILLIGATGYIGGAVLAKLLAHPSSSTFDITVIVRGAEKVKGFEKIGVKAVVGSFKEDLALVEELTENAHVVFSCADADDLPAIQAILTGLRKRHAKLGDLPILIHTSGTGILTEGQETKGERPTDVIYDDSDFDQVANIKPAALHRNVDLAVFQADKEGFVRTYIILPSTIWGIAKTPLTDAGLANPHSQQIPKLIHAALGRGRAGVVGKGLALWPDVHIDDVAELYIVLYDRIVRDGAENVDHGVRGYYYGENGEHSWYEISKAIGTATVELGLSAEAEPTAFTEDELAKYFGSVESGYYYGSNSRCRATHSRSLGWAPKYDKNDMLASIKPEIQALIKLRK